jgi:protease secretion system membrane fusion protein
MNDLSRPPMSDLPRSPASAGAESAAQPIAESRSAPAGGTPPPTPTADGIRLDTDDGRVRRWGWLLLIIGFGGFLLWAAFAPLDQGVPAPGTVMAGGNRKTIQPLQGGLVESILVKEGAVVKAGQPLVRLDGTRARSELEIARGQFILALSTEARLRAEQAGSSSPAFTPELLELADDPRAAQAIALQRQLLVTRRSALSSELAAIDEAIAGQRAQAQGVERSLAARREQLRLIEQELAGQRDLVREGYLPRNRLSEQERVASQLHALISEDVGNIARLGNSVAELKLRSATRRQQQLQEVEGKLAETQREVGALRARIGSLQFELANLEIRSPVDGMVVGLQLFTVGGVVQAGAPLMHVVPGDEPLRVDARIATSLIDRVHPGLPVDLMFTNFNTSQTPHIPGLVTVVGADVLIDETTRQPYYPVQVEVTDKGMHLLGQNRVLPGMQVQIFVRTGERTMFNYLIKPLLDRMQPALTER